MASRPVRARGGSPARKGRAPNGAGLHAAASAAAEDRGNGPNRPKGLALTTGNRQVPELNDQTVPPMAVSLTGALRGVPAEGGVPKPSDEAEVRGKAFPLW